MGKSLAERYSAARGVFEEADEVLGFALSAMCFEGPDDALKLTENTQPALLAVSMAACRVLAENGFTPDYVAGHSLGEYSALVAAGSLQFAGAVRLVRKRGQYMQEAVPAGVGAMAALLRLPESQRELLLLDLLAPSVRDSDKAIDVFIRRLGAKDMRTGRVERG